MWSAERTIIREGWAEKIALFRNGAAVSFAEIIAAWRSDAEFRGFFIRLLADAPYPAFFWEMPPVRHDTTRRDYEFVVIRSDALARMPEDPDAFAAKFRGTAESVVAFHNLGGDALLVAPRPVADAASYAHIAAFLRSAPEAQQHELFISLADAIDRELQRSREHIWISTSGLGVAWLHVRLDSFPKYYQHRPYAEDR
ncbi:MAG TPA: hypothetical protein VHY79_13015 [Rhizomicrobium sp.]|nr:hypothetical protein [Rhizomicrobium sp.]